MTDTQAKQALATAGLTGFKAGDPDTGTDCDKGKVSAQDPTAGNKVAADAAGSATPCAPGRPRSRCRATWSAGPRTTPTARSRDSAWFRITRQVDSTSAKDLVLKVDHQGDSVDPGTKITVTVSKGNQFGDAIVVGKTQEVAQGFCRRPASTSTSRTVDGPGTPGTVVEQDPARASPNRPRDPDVTIDVVQSNPPPTDNPSTGATTPPAGNGGGDGGGPVSGLLH